MGIRTGNPRGRPKGAKNKRTEERLAAMQEAAKKIEAAVPNAFEGDSHAFLVSVYKDPVHPIERRLDAAKAAIPYERPRLSTTELSGTLGLRTHEDYVKELQELGNRAAEAEALLAVEAQTALEERSKTHH